MFYCLGQKTFFCKGRFAPLFCLGQKTFCCKGRFVYSALQKGGKMSTTSTNVHVKNENADVVGHNIISILAVSVRHVHAFSHFRGSQLKQQRQKCPAKACIYI